MTADLILLRPEFYILFGFFVLLWIGTGNLVSPVAEIVTLTSINRKKRRFFLERKKNSGKSLKGPSFVSSPLTLWAIAFLLLSFFIFSSSPLYYVFLGGCFQKDPYTTQIRSILFLTRSLVLLVSLSWQKSAGICQSEYVYLALLAAIGGYELLLATDLMAMYLCIELQSFSLVVLCGLNSKSAFSLEAAIKYFLLSAFRSCVTLLGIGFVYWDIGETSIPHIERFCKRTKGVCSSSLVFGIWLISLGLLWKLAAAPLHFWVPDVYTGRWSSVSLWITLLPKIAVLGFWTAHWSGRWNCFFGGVLSLFRIFSIIVGRIAPLAQKDLKRLLSYSSIGHMGLILMPLAIHSEDSLSVLWAYVILYIFINLGSWGLLFWPTYRPKPMYSPFERENEKKTYFGSHYTNRQRRPQYIWDLKGLNMSLGSASLRWAVFIRSFAGLPPAYSFLGKRNILLNAINNRNYILVFVSLWYTIVSSVYYLKVMKVCYVDKSPSYRSYGRLSPLTAYIIALCAFVMGVGLWHGTFLF